MVRIREKVDIGYITEKYGNDLTNVDFSKYEVDVHDCDIRDVILPKDKDFLRNLSCSNLYGASMPEGDYSQYNFEGVDIDGTFFTEKSIFPKDNDLFLKVCNRNLYNATLPEGDYSEHCFDSVYIGAIVFTENSIFSKDKNVFQKIYKKNLYGATLPKGDYREYNFRDVNCSMAKFTFDSLLPEKSDFLQTISSSFDGDYEEDYIIGKYYFALTRNVIENIHRYDLDGVEIDLTDYADYLTESQLSIIRVKHKDNLNLRIALPKKGLLKENQKVKAKDIKNELAI